MLGGKRPNSVKLVEFHRALNLFALPLGKGFAGTSETGNEYLRAIAAPQGRSAELVGNDEVSVNILNLGRLFDINSRVQVSPHFTPPPRLLNTPEQSRIGPHCAFLRNEQLTVIDGLATELRRTAEPARSVTAQLPDPANDDEPDWREAEAA